MSTKIQLIKESEIFINPTDLMKYIYEMSEKFYTEKTVYLSPVEKNEAKSITPKISGPVIEKLVQELGESNTGYMIIRRDTEISVIIPPFPFSMDAIPTISQHVASELAGRMGNSKKVIILDLDNTLWGGEIGDVGQEGIILGYETSEGESYLEFQ